MKEKEISDVLFAGRMKVKVLNIKLLKKYAERGLYTFSLQLGEFIVNGFVYSRKTGAILSPTLANKRRIVRAFGMTWKRLRPKIEHAILEQEIETGDSSDSQTVRD